MTLVADVKIGALRIGGVEIEDWSVAFFSLHQKEPVYHRFGVYERGTHRDAVEATVCGMPTWNEKTNSMLVTVIPTQHAAKFGRPCLNCFPEVREAMAYKREVESAD